MKITHAQAGSTGRLFGVDFVDGIGHTDDPAAIERFRRQGHTIEPDLPERTAAVEGRHTLEDVAAEYGINLDES